MPNPPAHQVVNPGSPTQPNPSQPVAGPALQSVIVNAQNRLTRLENGVQGGVLLQNIDPTTGSTTVQSRLSVDSSGGLALAQVAPNGATAESSSSVIQPIPIALTPVHGAAGTYNANPSDYVLGDPSMTRVNLPIAPSNGTQVGIEPNQSSAPIQIVSVETGVGVWRHGIWAAQNATNIVVAWPDTLVLMYVKALPTDTPYWTTLIDTTPMESLLFNTLPAVADDGQVISYQDPNMATIGVVWNLRYHAASTSAYKWEFVGGGDYWVTGNHTQWSYTFTSQAYVAIPSPIGPSLQIMRPGEYMCGLSTDVWQDGGWVAIMPSGSGITAPSGGYGGWQVNTNWGTGQLRFLDKILVANPNTIMLIGISMSPGFSQPWSNRQFNGATTTSMWIRPIRLG